MKLLLSLCLSISFLSLASNAFSETLRSYQISKGHKNLLLISKSFEIAEVTDEGYIVYVLKEKEIDFKKLAPRAKLLEKDINYALKFNKSLSMGYHTYASTKAEIKNLAKKYPNLTEIIPYGKSKKGRELFSFKISKSTHFKKSKIMLTSATHGDEIITVEVILGLIKNLLENHTTNERLKNILDRTDIYFIPMVNPDGYAKRSRYTSNGIDPNRDYSWPTQPERASLAPCIDAIKKFYSLINFDGSMDFHAYGKMIMFPWGYTKNEVIDSDHNTFKSLTKAMAKSNKYSFGQISKIIYIAKGSSADYYYWKNNGLALGVELTTSKYPSSSRIPKVIKEAQDMTWTYLEYFSRPGISKSKPL